MKPRPPDTGTEASAPGFGSPPQADVRPGSPACHEDRACCCPAQPVVRVIMPPTLKRPYSVDLLLCGHHYRVSREALAAVQAHIEYLPGRADAAEAALLGAVHRDHADVTTGRAAGPA